MLYKNRYRVKTTRLCGWDYSSPGYYFITICVKGKEPLLGKMQNNIVVLSKYGEIVKEELELSPSIRKEIEIDDFVIMPNHLHIIVVINNVETHGVRLENTENKLHRKPKSLSSFVAGFKSAATKRINKMQNDVFFQWQPRFYDRIIRDENELKNIRLYIKNNPANFETDVET